MRASPGDVVHRLAAVQAQDYAGAKWAVGMRLSGAGDVDVEQAYDDGAILRTHMLRPTWHFCAPEDIRWLLMLTAPRVHAINAGQYRRHGLVPAIMRKAHRAIARALEGGIALTRDELRGVLARARIDTGFDQRMAYILMAAELDGLICSGPRRGRQFTYALLEERMPPEPMLTRDEALVELAGRFFHTRGPATPHDFAKWSGLTLADARMALDVVGATLEHESIGGRTLWFPAIRPPRHTGHEAHLLSIYDEFVSGYRDRRDIGDPAHATLLTGMGNALQFLIVLDGRVRGTWKRSITSRSVEIALAPFVRLRTGEGRAVRQAAERYGAFLGLSVRLTGLA